MSLVPACGAGENARWFRQCDEITKKVSEGVNSFLFQELLWVSDHCDLEVAELFRQGVQASARVVAREWLNSVCLSGAAMLGELERSGISEPQAVGGAMPLC